MDHACQTTIQSPEAGREQAVRALLGLLGQLFDLVEGLSNDQYTRKPVGVVESSIGGHVRHNLDHVIALLRSLESGEICYDQRDRGTDVEYQRHAALEMILSLEDRIRIFPWATLPATITLNTLVAPDLPPVLVTTSVERELAFVVSHTIHHNALIRVMVKLMRVEVAADFGYAPSTIVHQRSRVCARSA